MGVKITREALESYLHCKTKAHLKLAGQQGIVSDYEALRVASRQEVRQQAIGKILDRSLEGEVARDISLTVAALRQGPSIVLDATLEDEVFSLVFDGLKRVDGPSKLGDFHYIPMLFHEELKVGKEQRLLLEVYGVLLSQIQGRLPASGLDWHGRECKPTKVRLSLDVRKVDRLLREVKEMVGSDATPRLILNDHCQVCEFRQRCHKRAIEEDNLTLLRGLREKEVTKLNGKGIFTITQFSYTFRPRRRKRQKASVKKMDHSLQALSLRTETIYVIKEPQLPANNVRVYLDIEGDPDREFYYLIGLLVCDGNTREEYIYFWADTKEEGCRSRG